MKIAGIEIIPLDIELEKSFKGGTYEIKSRPSLMVKSPGDCVP